MRCGFTVGIPDILINKEVKSMRDYEVEKINQDYYKNIHMFRNLSKFSTESIHQKGKKVADSL